MQISSNSLLNGFIVVLGIVLAFVMGNAVSNNDLLTLLAFFGGIFGLLCLFIPAIPVFAAVALSSSGLTAPLLPFRLNFFHLLACMTMVCALFQFIFKHGLRRKLPLSYWFMAAFAIVVGFTILTRGSGMRALGSDTWGGFVYVQLYLTMGFAYAMLCSSMRPSVWRWALVMMGLLSTINSISDLLVLKGVNIGFLWQFMPGSGQIMSSYAAQESGKGVVRLISAGSAGLNLLVSFLILFNTKKPLGILRMSALVVPLVCFALILISGFRLMVIVFFLLGMVVMLFQKSFSLLRILSFTAILVLSFSLLIAFADRLPEPAQRALSFVPGISAKVDVTARNDAEGTIDWRLEVWRRAMRMLPEYWLVGKGFAFSGADLSIINDPLLNSDPVEWAIATSSFHNGLISLLIGLGIFGLISGLGILIGTCVRHIRLLRRDWRNPILRQCHQVMTAWAASTTLVFIILYGDVQGSIVQFFVIMGILESLVYSDDILFPQEPPVAPTDVYPEFLRSSS